ncbi:hypothetical protein JCM11251_006476 [Rhodosporidiobolus azoricus]
MEPEPTATTPFPAIPADADADMSIDYGAAGDAAMEEDAPRTTEITVEEAEMVDDETSGWEKEAATMDAMLEEDQPFQTEAVSAAPPEVPFAVDDTPLPVDFAQPASSLAPQDPALAPAPTEIQFTPAAAEEPVVSALSTNEPPSAVAAVEAPLEEALAGPELSSVVPPSELVLEGAERAVESAGTALPDGVPEDVPADPTPRADEAAAGPTAAEPTESTDLPPSMPTALEYTTGAASAAAAVEPLPSFEAGVIDAAPGAPVTEPDAIPSDSSSRPLVDKDPLLSIKVPTHPPAESSSSRGVPAVFFSFDNTTYSLFHPHRLLSDDDENEDGSPEEDLPLLLNKAEQHDLYYQPVEKLFRVVREHFLELKDQQDELLLEFDEIGIALGEDNVYSRQVTLFDFDRIHLGCQLPGRLHARLSSQGRFASGFNALAQHIANSYSASGEALDEEEGDASVTVAGDEAEAEEEGVEEAYEVLEEGEEGEEGGVEERPADDSDGPDSKNAYVGEGDVEGEGSEPRHEESQEQYGEGTEGQKGEDEFDLEQALAQLDGDDVVAVVEGVQEDYLLSENTVKPEEGAVVEGVLQEQGEADVLEERGDATEEVPVGEQDQEGTTVNDGDASADEPSADAATADAADDPIADAPQESVSETDLAQVAEEEGQDAPDAQHESSTAKLGEDALAAQVPVSDSATTGEDGNAAVAVTTAETVVNEDAAEPAYESAGATGDSIDATAQTALVAEEPADSTNDVIIDYDEVFDGSTSTSNRADVQSQPAIAPRAASGPTAAPIAAIADGEDGEIQETEEKANGVSDGTALLSPKRSREAFLDGQEEIEVGQDATAGDAKRPRLTDPVAVSSA